MRQQSLISEAYEPAPALCAFSVWRDADGRLMYPCPDALWRVHFDAWRKRRQRGETGICEPFPAGHCMFSNPRGYGIVPWDCTDPRKIARMIRKRTIANLNGWDRELRQTREGRRQLARIVRAYVGAVMSGADSKHIGAFPYMACIHAGL